MLFRIQYKMENRLEHNGIGMTIQLISIIQS
jgi:hypothetical protein